MNQEFANNIPIYVQLVERIKIDIISGRLRAGERLPSVREWAIRFQVNPNTMQKALAELEEEGLILTERTNGKFVTSDQNRICFHKEEYAKALTRRYFESMSDIGCDKTDMLQYLEGLGGDF